MSTQLEVSRRLCSDFATVYFNLCRELDTALEENPQMFSALQNTLYHLLLQAQSAWKDLSQLSTHLETLETFSTEDIVQQIEQLLFNSEPY